MHVFEKTVLIIGTTSLAYLIGAIPSGYLLARLKGVDIRKVGSGNIGATNVYRCVGKSWGILTFVLDFLKGYLPTTVFPMFIVHWSNEFSGLSLSLLCGGLAVIGHNWPVYLRFRGGKGMATGAGALSGFAPLAILIGLVSWLIVFATTRYVSLASIFTALIIAVSSWWVYGENIAVPAALSVMGAIVIWRHQSNIKRLLNGTEHRFKFGTKNSGVRSQ
ncbi:MAG: glycerol-3-phosphate 1-O-acyltransferase PlsY [Kiritimatiellia bacterium]|nr:glycerol-3-phosphate 1-O-acyltransferase PlsY [Kiritimatiellia bacterium]